jgi:MFS-type transporter involved in bile tolerance (Atg22 family)
MTIALIIMIPLYLFIVNQIDKLKIHWTLKYFIYMSCVFLGTKLMEV